VQRRVRVQAGLDRAALDGVEGIEVHALFCEKCQARLGQRQVLGTSQQHEVALRALVVEREVPREFVQSLAAVPGQALHAQAVRAVGAQAARAPPLPQP